MPQFVQTILRATTEVGAAVRLLTLQDPDGWMLPPYRPGRTFTKPWLSSDLRTRRTTTGLVLRLLANCSELVSCSPRHARTHKIWTAPARRLLAAINRTILVLIKSVKLPVAP